VRLPLSALDAINPAIEHTRRQLFQPFRFGQWTRIALVGLLAGELGSGGGCNVPSIPNLNVPQGAPQHFPPDIFKGVDLSLYIGLILVLVVSAFVLGILFMYISSVMRFILFDSVLAKTCHIRAGWGRRQAEGLRYFFWKLIFTLITFGAMVVLLGIPLGFAFLMGWLTNPREHLVALIFGGIGLFFVSAILLVSTAVIYVLTKDFVIPQMALENISAFEGWRRLLAMMKTEKGSYAGFVGMKIVLAIVAGIIVGIVGVIFALVIFVPAAGIAIAAVLAAKAAGVGWTVSTITMAVVSGCVLVAVFLYFSSLISVPAIIFFPAYGMYFFAARYPALAAILYPAPPTPQIPPAPPPYQPPPLPPTPEPIG
jgi:hypothetical protein